MSNQKYTTEFKHKAVRQVPDRGDPIAEVAERLGVSVHSLYKWVKAVKPDNADWQANEMVEAMSEILKLRGRLRRTEEERDILKKRAVLRSAAPMKYQFISKHHYACKIATMCRMLKSCRSGFYA